MKHMRHALMTGSCHSMGFVKVHLCFQEEHGHILHPVAQLTLFLQKVKACSCQWGSSEGWLQDGLDIGCLSQENLLACVFLCLSYRTQKPLLQTFT